MEELAGVVLQVGYDGGGGVCGSWLRWRSVGGGVGGADKDIYRGVAGRGV